MVKGGNSVFASSEDETKVAYAVDGGNIYFDKGTGAVYGYDGNVTNVVIPEQIEGVAVKSVERHTFTDCKSITGITFPNSMTFIGNYAFYDCNDNLTIRCNSGSYAEAYTIENNIAYKAMAEGVVYGDTNNSGDLTAEDAANVLQKVLNNSFELRLQNETDNWFAIVDVDCDNDLTAADAAMVLQKVLDSSFKMECEK